jgi:hypothetical protein
VNIAVATMLAVASVFLFRVQGPEHPPLGIAWASAAVALACLSLWRRQAGEPPVRRWALALIGGSGVAALSLGTAHLLSSWLLLPLHEAMPVAMVGGILHLVAQADVVASGHHLSIASGRDFLPLVIGAGRIDPLPLATYLCGYLVMASTAGDLRWRSCVRVLLLVAIYAPLKTAFLVLWSAQADQHGYLGAAGHFVMPWWRIAAILPVAILHLLIEPAAGDAPAGHATSAGHPTARTGFAVLVLAAAVLGAARVPWPGVEHGRGVVIDDFHSQEWEKASGVFDRDAYGSDWLYSYSTLAGYLADSHDVTIATRALDADLLRAAQVLVIKTPTLEISAAECALIGAFVADGGGLLLIGDHTDLLGMTNRINRLAEPYGARFRTDGSNRLSSGYFTDLHPGLDAGGRWMSGVEAFEVLTSCTIDGGFPGHDFQLLGRDIGSDRIDYSQRNFFGDFVVQPDEYFGCFPVVLAMKSGRGRVAMVADGTFLSNFWINHGDQYRLVANLVDYLSESNLVDSRVEGGIRLALALGSALVLILVAMRSGPGSWRLAAPAAVVIGGIAGWTLATAVAGFCSVQRTAGAHETIYFLGDHCLAQYPPPIGIDYSVYPYPVNSLFCAPQRYGWHAERVGGPDEIPGDRKAVAVIPYPAPGGEPAAVEAACRLSRRGIPVLVLAHDQALSGDRIARDLVAGGHTATVTPSVGTPGGLDLAARDFHYRDAAPITVVGAGLELSDLKMGHPFTKPDREQQRRYEALYRLLERAGVSERRARSSSR